jgi:hypothetical protein
MDSSGSGWSEVAVRGISIPGQLSEFQLLRDSAPSTPNYLGRRVLHEFYRL